MPPPLAAILLRISICDGTRSIPRMRCRVVVLAADVAGKIADNCAAHGAGLRPAPRGDKGPAALSIMSWPTTLSRPAHRAGVAIGAVMVDLRTLLPLHVTLETSPR